MDRLRRLPAEGSKVVVLQDTGGLRHRNAPGRRGRHRDDRVPPVFERDRIAPDRFVFGEVPAGDDAAATFHLGKDEVRRLPAVEVVGSDIAETRQRPGQVRLAERVPDRGRLAGIREGFPGTHKGLPGIPKGWSVWLEAGSPAEPSPMYRSSDSKPECDEAGRSRFSSSVSLLPPPASIALLLPVPGVPCRALETRSARVRIAGGLIRWRKVRAPQGRVPGNARAAQADGKCRREQTADGPPGHRQG